MTAEAFGHRGHPTHGEQTQADYVRQRLGAAVTVLQQQGFSHREALAFAAGLAFEQCDGERWASPQSAFKTVERLLEGCAAKFWSLRAINRALDVLAEVL